MKNKKAEAKKPGRKKKPVKQKTVEETIQYLAGIGCTNRSIANFLQVNETTLARNYESFLTKGRENLKMQIREKQIEVAMEGNVTMLIWCGKQYCDQKDKTDGEGGKENFSASHEIV